MPRVIKPAPGFPGYFVGSDGTVFSERNGTRRQLKTPLMSTGYPHCNFRRSGKSIVVLVHRIVCETFHGPPPSGDHEVRHLNGVRTDCRKENLAWGTRSENVQDAIAHGTAAVGERNGRAKLTQKQADKIRQMYDLGHSQRALAAIYHVSRRAIQKIVQNRSYPH